jgi:hypothetical protein
VKSQAAAAGDSPEGLAAAQERQRQIEAEMAEIMKRYHGGASRPPSWQTRSTMHVNGGISLRPGEFTIRTTPASPALKQFKQLAKGAAVEATAGKGAKRLVRSRPTASRPAVATADKPAPPASGAGGGAPQGKSALRAPAAAGSPSGAPSSPSAGTAAKTTAPKALPSKATTTPAAPQPAVAVEPPKPLASVAKNVSIPPGAAGAGRIVGELSSDGRIVCRKAAP